MDNFLSLFINGPLIIIDVLVEVACDYSFNFDFKIVDSKKSSGMSDYPRRWSMSSILIFIHLNWQENTKNMLWHTKVHELHFCRLHLCRISLLPCESFFSSKFKDTFSYIIRKVIVTKVHHLFFFQLHFCR